MKKYTVEEVYELVGKKDKTAQIFFIPSSPSAQKYGSYITVVFTYTQAEREQLDEMVSNNSATVGMIKAKYLVGELPSEAILELAEIGINSNDILNIAYFRADPANTFHSQETRTIKKIKLSISQMPKGQDYEWMYGFKQKLIREGIGMTPEERRFYLALKLYFEKEKLTEEENVEIFENDTLRPDIAWEFISIKVNREEASEEEIKQAGELIQDRSVHNKQQLDKYLQEAGSGFIKLAKSNLDQAASLLLKVEQFKEQKFTATGKVPIYLDIDGYLHVYMRHVEEMKVNKHFEHKDNFQWAIEDVTTVMQHVIQQIDKEVQEHFEKHPEQRYRRYGSQSIYFEGDYYTVYIEPNGRISTFFKNKKKAGVETEAL